MKTRPIRPTILATALNLFALGALATTALGDSSVPLNYTGINFLPITSATSSNYDFTTGELTPGTASASVSSTTGVLQAVASDPSPPAPNGFGTFIGTAHPERFDRHTAVFEQSACPTGYPSCLNDGTFTYGYFVTYNLRGDTLDELTTLATEYYVEKGCFGGGSPRFSIVMSGGSEIQVYLGTYPAFADCPLPAWQSTGNLATDSAGLRWDTSQLCSGTFYNTYSGAVACANLNGLTINSIWLGTDGGWSGLNPTTTQTFLFDQIQLNDVTRFPN
jgi:hypothetical protein